MIVGGTCAHKRELESFANGIYQEWANKLNDIKETHNIGMPPGVLRFNNDNPDCQTDQNLMVQSNVSFRPGKHGKGCTYIDKKWPIA